MNVIPIITGAAGLIFGGLIGHAITKRKYMRKLNAAYEELSRELSDMKAEMDILKRKAAMIPDAEWSEIEEQYKKGRKQIANETEPEDTTIDKTEDLAKRNEERKNYQAIASKYLSEIEDDDDDPSHGIIRRTASNGIYEIEDGEYRASREFPEKDLYFYEMSSALYFDNEEQIPEDEIPSYVGYSAEQLAVRFLHDEDQSYIYVRNPDHEVVYCIYVCQGVGPT
jgi:hypothetical protein